MIKKNLILTGGIRHNFDENTNAISKILNDAGFSNIIEENMKKGFDLITEESFDLVTVMALRWQMKNSSKYEVYRKNWGLKLTNKMKKIFEEYIKSGGGLFGFHTACLCFDDWLEWQKILGGTWNWDSSFHPPISSIKIIPTTIKHQITKNLHSFNIEDELYSNLDTVSSINVLMKAKLNNKDDFQPVLWTNNYGKGKIVFDGLGHDKVSIENSIHSKIIKRCATWASK